MSQTIIHIDPLTTNCVLKYLGLAIDEIKLVRSIDSISEQVRMSRASQLESGRKRYLVSELRFLNKRLRSVREKANLSTGEKEDLSAD
jgi:hypothetical protein